MNIEGHQIIGFNYSRNSDPKKFYAINPKTGNPITEREFHSATEEQMDAAVELAMAAHVAYKNKTSHQRGEFLRAIAEEIEKIGDHLTIIGHEETGLPADRLKGERGRTTGQLRLFADWIEDGHYFQATIDKGDPERKPLPKPDVRKMNHPLGPVVVFGASNFPLAFSVAGGDTASALAAGCPVIVKGHPAHPATSELVGKAIQTAAQRTNMPEGVFSLVHGNTHHTGEYLVAHPGIKAVGFTGSFRGGKALFDLAQKRPEPIPVYAEMGSTNPVFILPEALKTRKQAIATGLANSINLGAGQFCTNPGLFIVPSTSDRSEFTELLKNSFSDLESQTMLTPAIHGAYNEGTKDLQDSGYPILAMGKETAEPYAARPTLFQVNYSEVQADDKLTEEVFGPSSIMISAESEDEILEFARSLEGHLTATIHAENGDETLLSKLLPILQEKVGRIIYNAYPTGVEVCHAMVHGGPFPATTNSSTTSVGTSAIYRFLRPVCYQDIPQEFLPDALKDENPLGILRMVNGKFDR